MRSLVVVMLIGFTPIACSRNEQEAAAAAATLEAKLKTGLASSQPAQEPASSTAASSTTHASSTTGPSTAAPKAPPRAEPAAAPAAGLGGVTDEKVGELLLDLNDKLLVVAVAQKGNCDGVAEGWKELFDANSELLKKAKEISKRETRAQKRAFSAKHRNRQVAWMKKMTRVVRKCAANKKLRQVIKKLQA